MRQRHIYDPEHKRPFDLAMALDIQADQIDEWSMVLTAEAMTYLRIVVEAKNKALADIANVNPDSVCRGVELDSIVKNCMYRLYREACIATAKEEETV